MKHALQRAVLAACAVPPIFGQSDTRPKFVAAENHSSANSKDQRFRTDVRNGLYEIRNATMLDLAVAGYGFDYDKVLGGPGWIETDRFDIIAKLPDGTSPEDRNLMLQSLLEDRFKLVVQKVTRPIKGYALTAGPEPRLKKASGSEEAGCVPLVLDRIMGIPGWADSARFDITAKTPPDTAPLYVDNIGPPLRALLADRFRMAYHMGKQPGKGYSLEATKPKMAKADPASRTSCRWSVVPGNTPIDAQAVCTCGNTTMAQLVDSLNGHFTGLDRPIADATGLEGGWDFELKIRRALQSTTRHQHW